MKLRAHWATRDQGPRTNGLGPGARGSPSPLLCCCAAVLLCCSVLAVGLWARRTRSGSRVPRPDAQPAPGSTLALVLAKALLVPGGNAAPRAPPAFTDVAEAHALLDDGLAAAERALGADHPTYVLFRLFRRKAKAAARAAPAPAAAVAEAPAPAPGPAL